MNARWTRREFVRQVAGSGLTVGFLAGSGAVLADQKTSGDLDSAGVPPTRFPKVPDHSLTIFAGKPRVRGKQYGEKFKDAIHDFLEKEILQAFVKQPSAKEEMLRYAGACARAVKDFSPTLADELEGVAEGAGLKLEEVVLINLHEELCHKGVLPSVDHCTAMAAGPPDTRDGHTYVGQNWDWMPSVYGMSSIILWKRPEGPSLLGYAYPGLWAGAGLNSAGIALCWTSGQSFGIQSPRVGIPSYLLIAQMLYQDSLKGAVEEARRAAKDGGHAGWFTFLLADGKGELVNVEGTPEKLVVEPGRGHMARVLCASREMTGTAEGKPVAYHPQCQRMLDLLSSGKGKLDRPTLQAFFGDHKSTICKHGATLDSMLFDCTTKEAYVSRGPGCSVRWRKFTFDKN